MSDTPDTSERLLAAKLRAIVADRSSPDDGAAASGATDLLAGATELRVPGGAGLAIGEHGSFLVPNDGGLGAVLLIAQNAELTSLAIYTDSDGHTLARQARAVAADVQVWQLDGRVPVPVNPPSVVASPEPDSEAVLALAAIDEPDLRVVVEHGEAISELAGLEVARASVVDGELRVRVGVGRSDQELSEFVQYGRTSAQRVRDAAAEVRLRRHVGAPPHPLLHLVAERWVRARLMDSPQLVGLDSLEPVAPLRPRAGLKIAAPAAALGATASGEPVLVVCSTGVDPELVPVAAELRAERYPDADLLVVRTQADQHPAVTRLLDGLGRTRVHAVPHPAKPWPEQS
jgi:hypothetical protein